MIELVIEARRRDLGGFQVGRVLPFAQHRMVGPFIFFDHMGPMFLPAGLPRSADVRPHPHIGLATVTYLFDGELTHRDSTGVVQNIHPGDVNWMNAGRGISHSERFERLRQTGGNFHGIQAWVALPDTDEESEPTFTHCAAKDLPHYTEHGIRASLVAGNAFGASSPVQGRSPLFYVHTELAAGAVTSVPGGQPERAIYIAAGEAEIDGRVFMPGQMIVFADGAQPIVKANKPATLIMIGGEPVGPRHIWWNFVSSRKERIDQAASDWREGRFLLPPGDDQEFMPLSEAPRP